MTAKTRSSRNASRMQSGGRFLRLKPHMALPALVIGTVLAFRNVQAAPACPLDGDDSLWPTFETVEKCGSYDGCSILAQSGRVNEANACYKRIDDCGAAQIKLNERAAAHNAALEACRSSIWSTVTKGPGE